MRFFRKQGTCWRCIALIFNERSLDLYRSHERLATLDGILLDEPITEEKLCEVCLDVLAKAELTIPFIAEKVRESGFEFCDYKIAFSISIRAYLNRMLLVTRAEQSLQKDFSSIFNAESYRGSLDYKEAFKWIVSSLLATEVGAPANLDGNFLVNCNFQVMADE